MTLGKWVLIAFFLIAVAAAYWYGKRQVTITVEFTSEDKSSTDAE